MMLRSTIECRTALLRSLFAAGCAAVMLFSTVPAFAQKGRAPIAKPAIECDVPGGCGTFDNFTPSKDVAPNVGCNTINFTETLDTTAPAANPDYTAVTNTQTGRLLRNGTPSSCAVPKTNPGLNDTDPGRQFDAYTFTPVQSSCVTFTMTQPSSAVFFYAVSSYNPAAPDQNYLADAGSSTTTSGFSMNVTAGQPFTVVVNEVAAGGGLGTTYSINITGLCTAEGGPTNVNSQVTFTTTTQGLTGIAGACATAGYSNQYNINVDLRNIGTNTFTSPFFQLIELQQTDGTPTANPFRLRTADDFNAAACSGGLTGATQAIPGPIVPAQVIPVNFQIAMPQLRRFRFLVSVFATVGSPISRNRKTVKLGELAVTGLDRGGKPVVSATFTPEKGQPSLAVANVSATPAK